MKKENAGSVSKGLSSEKFATLITKALETMKKAGADGSFNVLKFAQEEAIKIHDAKRIFLTASGMAGFHVEYSEDVFNLGVVVTDRYKLSLKKNDFEYLNSKRDPENRFDIGDVFLISSSGDNIILTRKAKSSK